MSYWQISGHDSPGGQTFSFNLMIQSLTEEISQPSAGTYKIGLDLANSDVFVASLIDIIDRENHVQKEYATMPGEGTLTIEVSNDKQVKGHFEFTAHTLPELGTEPDRIQVNGKFDAVNLR